MNKDQLLTII